MYLSNVSWILIKYLIIFVREVTLSGLCVTVPKLWWQRAVMRVSLGSTTGAETMLADVLGGLSQPSIVLATSKIDLLKLIIMLYTFEITSRYHASHGNDKMQIRN